MTQGVQFNVLVKDLGSNPLAKFAKNAEKSVNRVKKITKGLENLLSATDTKTNKLTKTIRSLGGKGELGINKKLKATSGHLDRISNKLNKIKSLASMPVNTIGGLVPATAPTKAQKGFRQPSMIGANLRNIAAIGGGVAAFQGIKNIIGYGSEMEQLKIAFETMLGSASKADKLIQKLNEFANQTPYMNSEVTNLSRSLLAYNFSLEELMPTINVLGNIAAGVGKERLPFLTLALGQVRAATKLTGMELRQFTENGVPLLYELSQSLGKSEAEIKELISKGGVSFDDVQNALRQMTSEGGRFFNLMQKQSRTLSGRWSTFVGKLQLGLAKFSKEGINLALKKLTEFGIEIIDKFKPVRLALGRLVDAAQPAINSIKEIIKSLLPFKGEGTIAERVIKSLTIGFNALAIPVQVASSLLVGFIKYVQDNWRWLKYLAGGITASYLAAKVYNAVLPISIAITKAYAFAVGMLTGKIKLATIQTKLLNIAMRLNPVGLIITGITALGAVIVWAWNKLEKFRFGAFAAFNVLKLVVQGVWNWLGNIGNLFSILWSGVLVPFGNWVFNNLLAPLGHFFKSIGSGLATFFSFVSDKIKPLLQGFITFIQPFMEKIAGFFQPVIDFFDGVWNKIQALLSKISQSEFGQALFSASQLGLINEITKQLSENKVTVAVADAQQKAKSGVGTFDFSGLTKGLSIQKIVNPFQGDLGSGNKSNNGDAITLSSPKSTSKDYGTGQTVKGDLTVQIGSLIENVTVHGVQEIENIGQILSDELLAVVKDFEMGMAN